MSPREDLIKFFQYAFHKWNDDPIIMENIEGMVDSIEKMVDEKYGHLLETDNE